MRQQIAAYLDQPDDYAVGLALLEQTGFSGYALTILRLGDDSYNRKRLIEELNAYLSKSQAPTPVPPPAPVVTVPATTTQDALSSIIPFRAETAAEQIVEGLVESINQQIYPLLDERATLKSQIWTVQTDDMRQGDRRDWAYGIKRLTRELDDLYSQIDFVKQYGYAPPDQGPAVDSDDQALLMNARTYVSRYKKKLAGATTDQKRSDAQAKLTEWLDEKNRLELKLGNR